MGAAEGIPVIGVPVAQVIGGTFVGGSAMPPPPPTVLDHLELPDGAVRCPWQGPGRCYMSGVLRHIGMMEGSWQNPYIMDEVTTAHHRPIRPSTT